MIESFQNSKNVNLNGTISGVPIKYLWWMFFGLVAMIMLLLISSDFTNLWALLIKVSVIGSLPVVSWLLLRTMYLGDHIRMVAMYRFYFKKNQTNYEVSTKLYTK